MARVVLLTRDSAYSRVFLKRFLAESGLEVAGLVLSSSYLWRGRSMWRDLAGFVGRVGVPYALYQAYVAWWLPRRLGLSAPPTAMTGLSGVPVLHSNDINSPHARAWLVAQAPDFILSFHFNQRLGEAVLALPTRAAVNFHPSLLPDWRGVDPVFFALHAGKATTLGGSLHLITAGLDEGDILLRQPLAESASGMLASNAALFDLGARMATQALADFDRVHAQRQAQDVSAGRYYAWQDVGRERFKLRLL